MTPVGISVIARPLYNRLDIRRSHGTFCTQEGHVRPTQSPFWPPMTRKMSSYHHPSHPEMLCSGDSKNDRRSSGGTLRQKFDLNEI